MDPYIEDPEIWGDFHGDLAAQIRAVLNQQIQPRYVARLTPRVAYYVMLSRADCRPTVDVWPIQWQDRLPVLPIPLLEPDPDAVFDLGAAVAEVYERSGYANLINYTRQPPPPPLDENSVRWLEDHLRSHPISNIQYPISHAVTCSAANARFPASNSSTMRSTS
jgi:hypothetical protein